MTVPGSPNPASTGIRTLAGARLPPRVRNILESLLRAASDEFERRLGDMLVEFEQQLFRLADHARNAICCGAGRLICTRCAPCA